MNEQPNSPLSQAAERLEALARQLADEKDEGRAAELVREASKLAAEAGEEAERALRQTSTSAGGAEPG